MFRGGDYIDKKGFFDNEKQPIYNYLDVTDINKKKQNKF